MVKNVACTLKSKLLLKRLGCHCQGLQGLQRVYNKVPLVTFKKRKSRVYLENI